MFGRGGRRPQGGGSGGGGFLEVANNLSDLANAGTAQQNLGLTTNAAGQVLLGDGSRTSASDANLFFDTTNKRLGVRTTTPQTAFHLYGTAGTSVALIEEVSAGGTPELRFQNAGAVSANLSNGDTVGSIAFYARASASNLEVARIEAEYTGNGTTQSGDLLFYTSNAGAATLSMRLDFSGKLFVSNLAQGAAYIGASGELSTVTTVSSTELGFLDGVTSGIQSQLDGKQATGSYITALTGDVTASGPGSVAATIANNAVSNAKLAQMSANTIKGNNTGGAGNAVDLTTAQATAMLDTMTGGGGTGLKGLVPAQLAGDVTKFLAGNATWTDIPASRAKAKKASLSLNDTSKAITFTTPRADANYTPMAFLVNTVDTDPIHSVCVPIVISTNGFTVEWGDAVPSANYEIYWGILEHYDP